MLFIIPSYRLHSNVAIIGSSCPRVACVADETKPQYSSAANQRPKASSVLPGFSIIGSYWLLHMAVLSVTMIGRVAWNHGYTGGYTT